MNMLKLNKKLKVDEAIQECLEYMKLLIPSSVEYTECVKNLEMLNEMKIKNRVISPEGLLMIGGNLLGLLLIMKFEKTDVLVTKALGFVFKGRA
jgi:hypothetical protein